MSENTEVIEVVQAGPVVTDGGDVIEVTLGTKSTDSADDTEYKV